MRICLSYYEDVNNPWRRGGGSLTMWEVGRKLAKRGHSIMFVTGNYPNAKSAGDGIRYFRLGSAKSYKSSVNSYYLTYPIFMKRIEKEFDILLEGWTSPFPFIPLLIKKPVVAWIHILNGINLFETLGAMGIPNYFSEKTFTVFYQSFILYSPNYIKLGKSKNVLVCPPAFESRLLDVRREEEPYILFMGRLAAGGLFQKGLDMLFPCFVQLKRLFPNLRLVIAGNGDFQALASAKRLSRGIEGVEFVGHVQGVTKIEFLRKCLLVCMPSRFESAGIVALEAQACGKPVIGFDIPGLNFIVRNHETAILVPPFDLKQLTEGMRFMIDNPLMRRQFGDNGRKWAMNFTWEKATEMIDSFLTTLV
jgi:glycogen synthase